MLTPEFPFHCATRGWTRVEPAPVNEPAADATPVSALMEATIVAPSTQTISLRGKIAPLECDEFGRFEGGGAPPRVEAAVASGRRSWILLRTCDRDLKIV